MIHFLIDPLYQVWSVSSLSTVATLSGHKFGVSCVAFTPSSQYVVSVSALHFTASLSAVLRG